MMHCMKGGKDISVVDELNQASLIPTTHTVVKDVAGTANSRIRNVAFQNHKSFVSTGFPPAEVVNWSVH